MRKLIINTKQELTTELLINLMNYAQPKPYSLSKDERNMSLLWATGLMF